LRTAFNGFDRATLVEVSDRAMLKTAGYEVTAAARPSDLFKAAYLRRLCWYRLFLV
jgi:hypothetical protein